jgi:hypothetical protein
MDVNLQATSQDAPIVMGMSDEERIAILADVILEAISLEDQA